MVTDKLNRISIEISNIVGDPVTIATANGDVFTADMRLKAINMGRQKIYSELLTQLKVTDFLKVYPEYRQNAEITYSAGFAKPAGCRKVISASLYISPTVTTRLREVNAEMEHEARYNAYSALYSQESSLAFTEKKDTIEIINKILSPSNKLLIVYLAEPNILTGYNGTEDIIEPEILVPHVIEISAEILLREIQND